MSKKIRPPVVVVLGHVDHGKSSLLEAIKDLKITKKESGGITQHIGAYSVEQGEGSITFIDTPGHEAFSAMRSRGAQIADIGVLVVAAEEGVKAQTKEAIKHLKETGMPFLVAINKIDKKEADPEKVKGELASQDILVESYGGKIPSIEVSAETKKGIEDLLEMIGLLAEMEDLEADFEGEAKGVVIETQIDPKIGMTTTLLLKEGKLSQGDIVGTSFSSGVVRSMEDFQGKKIEKATPSMPVKVSGIKGSPQVGEEFKVYKNLKEVERKDGEKRIEIPQELNISENALNLIIKADVLGSVEAIMETLKKIPREKIGIKIIKAGVGEVNENNVDLARAGKAVILAFRVGSSRVAENLSLKHEIEILKHDIIYEMAKEVRERMTDLLETEIVEEEMGEIKVLAVFKTQRERQIIGGKLLKGSVEKGSPVKIFRGGEEIGKGSLINLKKEEKDVEKIPEREEFGMLFQGETKVEEGDTLIPFQKKEIKPEL